MNKISVLIILLLFTTKDVLSQKEVNKIGERIQNLSRYRDYLLRRNPNATKELKFLFSKWDSLSTKKEERAKVTLGVVYLRKVYNYKNKLVKKKLLKEMPASRICRLITDKEIDIINRNSELVDMINFEVLKNEYPFNISREIFEELESYDLKENERIGEIGCGIGTFGILISKIEPSVELFLNELDDSKLEYIKLVVAKSVDVYDTKNIHIIEGGKTTTNMENFKLDKIIIRNTFHHFKKKSEMLKSIKQSLNENGELMILEAVRGLNEDNEDLCKLAMKKDEIEKIFEENGFELKGMKQVYNSYLMKFKIKKE